MSGLTREDLKKIKADAAKRGIELETRGEYIARMFFEDEGYRNVRKLPDGKWIGVQPMLFTVGLFVGLKHGGYEQRYCYEHADEALKASWAWDGQGDPPGPWIKEKPGDRLGPGALE